MTDDIPQPFAPEHSEPEDLTNRLVGAGNEQLRGLQLLILMVEAANEIERLRAEVAALTAESKQHFDQAMSNGAKLAALRKRVEEAPVTEVAGGHLYGGWVESSVPSAWTGKRVRLVVEDWK